MDKKNYLCQGLDSCVPVADRVHIMLINEIIIIHLSKCIEFYFDRALNTIELSIRATFFEFFCMYREWRQVWMENVKNYWSELS